MTPKGYLITVGHPDMDGVYIMRARKFKNFVKINKKTWEKYGLDPDKFLATKAWLKDKEIDKIITTHLPEDFL